MTQDERADSDIRKRAAWLLAMLAVVAGLFVLLSVTLFNTSGGGGTDHGDDGLATTIPTSQAPSVTPTSPAGSSSSAAPSSGSATGTLSSPVPEPSCPDTRTCAVQGDVGGAMRAINAYRSQHGKKAVPTTSTSKAARCAITDGGTCPSSFVWVRVEDLSGSGVVQGVSGFNSSDDLLDDSARSFEVGWAYDPTSKSLSCALIRND